MAKIFDKIVDWMNLPDDDEQDGVDDLHETQPLESFSDRIERSENNDREIRRQFRSYSGGKDKMSQSKVSSFQTSIQTEVNVIQPLDYTDARDICHYLIQHMPVIINLEKIDHQIAQRIMDFVSGCCYTLEGKVQKITTNIFLIAPANVNISGNFTEELKTNGIILPWKEE